MQHYIRTSRRIGCTLAKIPDLLQRKLRASIALPPHRRRVLTVAFGENLYFLTNHKSRIKSQPKMPNDIGFILPFILAQELFRTAKGNLVKIFIYFLSGHSNSLVGNSNGLFLLIQLNING